jgi:hypothetical protein
MEAISFGAVASGQEAIQSESGPASEKSSEIADAKSRNNMAKKWEMNGEGKGHVKVQKVGMKGLKA